MHMALKCVSISILGTRTRARARARVRVRVSVDRSMYMGINEGPYDPLCVSGSAAASPTVAPHCNQFHPGYLISNLHLDGARRRLSMDIKGMLPM